MSTVSSSGKDVDPTKSKTPFSMSSNTDMSDDPPHVTVTPTITGKRCRLNTHSNNPNPNPNTNINTNLILTTPTLLRLPQRTLVYMIHIKQVTQHDMNQYDDIKHDTVTDEDDIITSTSSYQHAYPFDTPHTNYIHVYRTASQAHTQAQSLLHIYAQQQPHITWKYHIYEYQLQSSCYIMLISCDDMTAAYQHTPIQPSSSIHTLITESDSIHGITDNIDKHVILHVAPYMACHTSLNVPSNHAIAAAMAALKSMAQRDQPTLSFTPQTHMSISSTSSEASHASSLLSSLHDTYHTSLSSLPSFLRLIDDDKKQHIHQLLLTDMFQRMNV